MFLITCTDGLSHAAMHVPIKTFKCFNREKILYSFNLDYKIIIFFMPETYILF